MSSRAVPYFCPYCADDDLLPHPDGGWHCRACTRVFTVKLHGLVISHES